LLISIWNFLRGYVMIEVVGFSIERFLNMAAHRDIYIWNIERQGHKIDMNVSVKGYKMLKLCARKTGCKIKIKRKIGLPFITYHYRKRKMLPIGIFLFIILIYTMASFVWLVEVAGNEKITSQEIVEQLAENGYAIGGLKCKMNLRGAEKVLMGYFPGILWTGIYFEGTKLMVEVTETVPEPLMVDHSSPANIVAKSDAVILDIITRKGTPLVKQGDTVRKGDVLVKGAVPIGEEEEIIYVHASADIMAKTYYVIKTELPIKKIYKDYTKGFEKSYTFRLLDKTLNIYKPKVKFTYWDYVIKSKQLQITSKFVLPFYWIEEQYIEYIPKLAIISDEIAQDKLTIMLDEILKKTIHENGEVIKTHIKFEKKDGIMIGTLQAIVKEELGKELSISSDHGRN